LKLQKKDCALESSWLGKIVFETHDELEPYRNKQIL
jgi:hypothetical protein